MKSIGNFLLFSAIFATGLTFWPVITTEIGYRYRVIRKQEYVVTTKTFNLMSVDKYQSQLQLIPLSTQFGVVIPKIGANAVVMPNIDPGNQQEYDEALKKGVAHAKGSVYPGQVGNVFLFAHSVGNFWEVNQWNAIFYLLRELNPGDEVDLFYNDRRYIYLVYDKKIVDPSEVNYLFTQSDFPMVTLQTCWPPGTTLKRLLVFGRLKNS